MKTFKLVLWLALLTGAIWFAVVLAWQVNDVQPSGSALVLYLAGLPLLAIGAVLAVGYGLRRRRQRAQGMDADAATPAAQAFVGEGEQAPRAYALHLHATAVNLVVGASAEAAAAALVEPVRPGLHPTLKDENGLPVMAAQVDDLDTEAVAEALQAAAGSDAVERVFAQEHLRAVALLEPVLEELLGLEAAIVTGAAPADAPPALVAGRRSEAAAPPKSRLRTLILVADSWPQPARQQLGDWALAKAAALDLPEERIAVEVVPVAQSIEAWALLDRIGQRYRDEVTPDRHLLLACASQLSEGAVEALQAARRLIGHDRPEGLIPGEGAVGLWLSGPPEPGQPASPDALELRTLQRGHVAAGTSSRNATRQTSELMARALAAAGRDADSVKAVVSDADQRPSRAIEIASAIAATCPELDPIGHNLSLGVACGHLGPVAPWAAIAVAAAQARAEGGPALAIGLADGEARAALAVMPVPPPPSPPAEPDGDRAG
ncbi:hypothetical protein SAMN04487939_10661 [Lysobacter sp. yr284]|uniref:hypothetical protein n=1 Tax=Lysobacter sp. yr284 TaxID=1761791 RepID=UPI00089D4C65|nr:hypothetical protein [Lysobacter sp. yr284]SDY78305.1 hypothetical protein SAMN04487939_10661 [Lysobacter sp. yr284]